MGTATHPRWLLNLLVILFFFFQAEDGIRDTSVTGVQTCALPIFGVRFLVETGDSNGSAAVFECYVPAHSRMPVPHSHDAFEETIYGLRGVSTWTLDGETRSEERRVGKEGRSGGWRRQ